MPSAPPRPPAPPDPWRPGPSGGGRHRCGSGPLGYWLYQYKRDVAGSVTTSFLYPVLYLAAIGVGLGILVDQHATRSRA